MEIFILWLFLSIVAGLIADNKGRSGFGFFLLAALLTLLIGIIAALIANEDRDAVEEKQINSGFSKKCPFCAELVKAKAKICKHCGKEFPELETEKNQGEQTTKGEVNAGFDPTKIKKS